MQTGFASLSRLFVLPALLALGACAPEAQEQLADVRLDLDIAGTPQSATYRGPAAEADAFRDDLVAVLQGDAPQPSPITFRLSVDGVEEASGSVAFYEDQATVDVAGVVARVAEAHGFAVLLTGDDLGKADYAKPRQCTSPCRYWQCQCGVETNCGVADGAICDAKFGEYTAPPATCGTIPGCSRVPCTFSVCFVGCECVID